MSTKVHFQSLRLRDEDTTDAPPRSESLTPVRHSTADAHNDFTSFEKITSLSPNRHLSISNRSRGSTSYSNPWDYGNLSPETQSGRQENHLFNSSVYHSPLESPALDARTDSLVSDCEKPLMPSSPLTSTPPFSPYNDLDFPPPGTARDSGGAQPSPMSSSWYPSGWQGLTHIPKRAQQHPFAKNFEPPRWRSISFHVLMCVIAYPLMTIFTVMARGNTLFFTRLVVGLGCGLVGFLLGLSLLGLGRAFLEAATWATVIHQSCVEDVPGVKLKDIAATSVDGTSALPAFLLLWDRQMYPGASRKRRSHYDQRPWSLFILFFLIIVLIAGSVPFVLGRLVDITTTVKHQRDKYQDIAIYGDNSDTDILHASKLRPLFDSFALTWTLSPFSSNGHQIPPAVTFQFQNDSVYFSETSISQLLPNGSGFGTFDSERTDWALASNNGKVSMVMLQEITVDPTKTNVEPGSILRFPKWGTRLHCASVPDIQTNLVPESPGGFTYLFTPSSVVQALSASFGGAAVTGSLRPFNSSKVLQGNDTMPPNINASEIAVGAAFYGNGVAHSFFSKPMSQGGDGQGWMSFEQVLVRLNTTYTPNGTFPVLSAHSVPDVSGKATHIGYDAVVCMQLFEPWIVEVYNSTTGPGSVRLVERGKVVPSANTSAEEDGGEKRVGARIANGDGTGVRTELNSTRLWDVYVVAHTNSINELLKDNGRDTYYVPSQTVISFTDGRGAYGYTSLLPDKFAQARGRADATNILRFFSGSGLILGQQYHDLVISSASVNPMGMLIYLALVLTVGLIAGFFVPRLPLGMPRRDFELYTWMAAFQAEELVGERSGEIGEKGVLRNMELDEIERAMGDLKFRYAN